jgi:hypothetical protein
MFEIECFCAGEPLSPGQSGCIPMVGRDKYIVLFDYIDSDGNYNGVTKGTVMNLAWITAKLNHVDPTKRWTIFPEIFALEAPAPESEVETIDGIDMPTGEEIKQKASFQHVKEAANPALKASYDSYKCRDLGMLTITYKGQLAGMNDGQGNLIGVHLQEGSLTAQYMQPTKGSVQKMMVTFYVDELENDADRDFIAAEQITYPAKKWFDLQPLQLMPLEVTNSGQDTIVMTVDMLYGGVDRKKKYTGLVSNDFSYDKGVTDATVYNVTQGSSESVTVAETGGTGSGSGEYTLTLGSATDPNDVVRVDIFKSGVLMRSLLVTMVAS